MLLLIELLIVGILMTAPVLVDVIVLGVFHHQEIT